MVNLTLQTVEVARAPWGQLINFCLRPFTLFHHVGVMDNPHFLTSIQTLYMNISLVTRSSHRKTTFSCIDNKIILCLSWFQNAKNSSQSMGEHTLETLYCCESNLADNGGPVGAADQFLLAAFFSFSPCGSYG